MHHPEYSYRHRRNHDEDQYQRTQARRRNIPSAVIDYKLDCLPNGHGIASILWVYDTIFAGEFGPFYSTHPVYVEILTSLPQIAVATGLFVVWRKSNFTDSGQSL